jgi:hypothetical protein
MLNRAAVIVRPKQPYLDWAAGLDDAGVAPEVGGERTVYLIPSYDTQEEAWDILAEAWESIFDAELWDWHTDEAAWPPGRTFAMFKEWFDVEIHSVVEDLCGYELVDTDVA